MKRIILVDDDLFIRDLVATKLNGEKYAVEVAASVSEGLKVIDSEKPDLVILDLELPDGHGLDLLRKIKFDPKTKEVPVIIFSNIDDPDIRMNVKEAGADESFLKVSLDMSELESQVDKYFV